eukprot:c22472_g1_i3 orf=303-503(+)
MALTLSGYIELEILCKDSFFCGTTAGLRKIQLVNILLWTIHVTVSLQTDMVKDIVNVFRYVFRFSL